MYIRKNGILSKMTAKEIEQYNNEISIPTSERIVLLKQNLADTDYKAIKYAEGLISEEEYQKTKAQRQAWRDEINRLESEEC